MAKLKVLITHAVPVNNGDAALVIGLYNMLISAGYEVTIATFYYDTVKEKYPDLPFIRELGDYYFLRKLPFLKPSFIRLNFALNKQYNSHDVYIAAPGGYVNSYYYLSHALAPLIQAHRHGKKTAIYAQSIGPLNSQDQARFVEASSDIDLVMVRDVFSQEVMKTLAYPGAYFKTKDAAFLMPLQANPHSPQKRVAVSVRQWGHDNRDMAAYLALMAKMCNYLVQIGYEVVFLSTCQGVPNYKDDSEVALKAQTLLETTYGLTEPILVDRNYYTLDALMQRMQDFDLVIGTRLHMCILSWINRVPALNISYEVKGKECYDYLGIPEYSIDFNQDAATSMETLEAFVHNLDEIKTTTLKTIENIHTEVTGDFKQFQQLLLEES
jgi:colanic acid/amylovoran biosynthesis protein